MSLFRRPLNAAPGLTMPAAGSLANPPPMAQAGCGGRCQVGVHVRWMIRRDMAEVLEIEKTVFEFPWSDEDFIRCLRQRTCIGMVAEHDDLVVGFMVYELRPTYTHVLNFAVAKGWQRKGVGRQMIARLIAGLTATRRSFIRLEVRESNLAAQLFFRAQGFRAISVLEKFYDDTPEDAYLMQYRLQRDRDCSGK